MLPVTLPANVVYNGYVGAVVIAALEETGVLEQLMGDPATLEEISRVSGCDIALLEALILASAKLAYVEEVDCGWQLTAAGEEMRRYSGFFGWAVNGYGDLFSNLGELARGRRQYGSDLHRDEGAVARYSGKVDQALMEPLLYEILDPLEFHCFADIGCGSARRLIGLCQRYPKLRGVGIDISADACAVAIANVAGADLSDRITIIHQDVMAALSSPPAVLAAVDIVGSFMMLHDLLAVDPSGGSLSAGLAQAFPASRHYIIADTVLLPDRTAPMELPVFSLGFELAHAFMRTRLYTREHYEQVFSSSGLSIKCCREFGAPSTWAFLLGRGD